MKFRIKKIYLIILVMLVVIGLISYFGIKLYLKQTDLKNNEYINLKFESGIEKLKNFETDYHKIGWLQVQGTNIDLPILEFTSADDDNLDYSYGWRPFNYSSDSKREILLGHNVLNVSSEPILSSEALKDFESLMSFSYAGFAKDNLYIQYTKNGVDEIYAIYAVGFYDSNSNMFSNISSKDGILSYIENVKKNSVYDYGIEVDENDDFLSLKTCTRYFGLYEKQEFQIDARKLRKDEKTIKYNVSTNEIFDQLLLKKDNE